MGILFGLLSAVGFGTADFTARMSAERIGAWRTLYYMQFIGAIAVGAYILITGELAHALATAGFAPFGVAILNSLVGIGAAIGLYRGLEIGKVSVVTPITASYSALVVVLGLLSGETLTPLRALGIVFSIIGVIVVSIAGAAEGTEAERQAAARTTARSIAYAVMAAICFAISFYVLGFVLVPQIGSVIPVFIARVTTILVLFLAAQVTTLSLMRPTRASVKWIVALSILDTVGFLMLTLGVATEQVTIVSVLSSQYSAITVLLAAVFLREHIRPHQWIGILIIFAGILLVSLPATP